MKRFVLPYLPGIALLFIFIIISFIVYKDYGVSWDEWEQRNIGIINYNYIFHGNKELFNYHNRFYGVAFEMPLIFLEKLFHFNDSWDVYFMRHLVTHLFFLFSCFCGYILVYRLYKNKFMACIAFLMLAMMPRIYAHSYFNSKDIPLLAMFTITFTLMQIAFDKKNLFWFIMLGFACGYTSGIRISGCILTIFISVFFIFDIVNSYFNKIDVSKIVNHFFFFLISSCIIFYSVWPILWQSPINNFIMTFRVMSHYPYYPAVFFNGQIRSSLNLPFNYFPIWFSITVPAIWLITGLVGVYFIILRNFRNPLSILKNTDQRNFLFYLLCFITPIVLVIFLNSVLYDDWRHLYFIYPSFVMLSMYTFNEFYNSRFKIAIKCMYIFQIVILFFFMIVNHPFQEVYFNFLISHKSEHIRNNYDLDYWGASVKQGLEYIAKHDKSEKIKVANHVLVTVLLENIPLLPYKDRIRFQFVEDNEHPDYFITNFRNHPGDYDFKNIFYEIKVLNSTILRVYKLN